MKILIEYDNNEKSILDCVKDANKDITKKKKTGVNIKSIYQVNHNLDAIYTPHLNNEGLIDDKFMQNS